MPSEAGGDPVPTLKHVARDLRLDGVDVVHEVRRADHQWQKAAAGHEQNKKVYAETVEKSSRALNVPRALYLPLFDP